MTDLMLRVYRLNEGNYNKSLVQTSFNSTTLVSNTNVIIKLRVQRYKTANIDT